METYNNVVVKIMIMLSKDRVAQMLKNSININTQEKLIIYSVAKSMDSN